MTKTTHARPRRLAILAVALAAAPTLAQGVPPDYGHDFVTIGAPGNRGVTPAEAPMWDFDRFGTFGDVGYEYRITRTEVTNAQYHEFVDAYVRVPGRAIGSGSSLTGLGLYLEGFDPWGIPDIRILPGAEQLPANPTWEFAARYTNWLHNDKGTDLEDFETGVYDTSTFGIDPVTGKRTDQLERSPGSRYFLPSHDEWIKAAHYDPNRYGEGQEGYWYYPGASDDPLVGGMPGEPGAETSVGQMHPDLLYSLEVGQYPDTNGPWGLLDTSGGVKEWTETAYDPDFHGRIRVYAGSDITPFGHLIEDRLDDLAMGLSLQHGFRVASVVPAPGVGAVMLVGMVMVTSPRKRR